MAINFYPNREQLSKEVEQQVTAGNVDMLLGLCRCCIYNIFEESTIVTECLRCGIQRGLLKIADKRKVQSVMDLDYLGVC